MNRHITIIILAVLLVIIPILGFPGGWKSFFTIVLGLIIGVISFLLYREDLARDPMPRQEPKSTTYVDNLSEQAK